MKETITPETARKWWNVLKTIIEIILAALGGAATATVAQSCGLLSTLAQL